MLRQNPSDFEGASARSVGVILAEPLPALAGTQPLPQPTLGLIVEEALAAVFAPAKLYEVLDESLRTAELPNIPEAPMALRIFLEGALFTTLTGHVAVGDALEIVHQIRSSLELAMASLPDERPSSAVRERITLPAPPARVIVATNASLVVFLLGDMLGDAVDVVPVANAGDLEDRVVRFGGSPLLVVVDRKHACVDASVLDILSHELDQRSTIVWWAAEPDEQALVTARLQNGPVVVPTDPDLRLADLGQLCRNLTLATE